MCGLISVIGKITTKEEKIFKQGLIVDVLRGEHSTGVAITRRGLQGETHIAKQVGNPFELFNDKRFDKAMAGWNRVMIGHNRYATQGAVNKANAHPFEFWPVYGAHNGTLVERADLEDNKIFSVDSQALFNHISVHGVEDAISKVRGAWALTWWNEDDQTFNVLRNKERTLFMAKDKSEEVIFFSSEAEMLQLILNRNGVQYDSITAIPEDKWYSFKVGPEGQLEKPRVKEVKGKVYVAPPQGNVQNKGKNGNPHAKSGGTYSKDGQQTSSSKTTGKSTPTTVKGFDSAVLRKGALLALIERKVDQKDIEYYVIRDVEHPLADIRLYPPKGGIALREGDVVLGNIFHFVTDPSGHYRVSPQDIVKANEKQIEEYDRLEANLFLKGILTNSAEVEVEQPAQFYDHRGRLLSLEAWREAYPNCDWCTQDVDPNEVGTYLSKSGSVLCPDCAKDQSIIQYVHD